MNDYSASPADDLNLSDGQLPIYTPLNTDSSKITLKKVRKRD